VRNALWFSLLLSSQEDNCKEPRREHAPASDETTAHIQEGLANLKEAASRQAAAFPGFARRCCHDSQSDQNNNESDNDAYDRYVARLHGKTSSTSIELILISG
jgi:hypothetical protein